jgi:hypothetical protein
MKFIARILSQYGAVLYKKQFFSQKTHKITPKLQKNTSTSQKNGHFQLKTAKKNRKKHQKLTKTNGFPENFNGAFRQKFH